MFKKKHFIRNNRIDKNQKYFFFLFDLEQCNFLKLSSAPVTLLFPLILFHKIIS